MNRGKKSHFGALLSAATVALVMSLSGCSIIVGACPAVLYLDHMDATLTGSTPVGLQIEACMDSECETSGEPVLEDGAPFNIDFVGERAVRISSAPNSSTVQLSAIDGGGDVQAKQTFDLEWTRNGGSEQCGGPMETPALTFHI